MRMPAGSTSAGAHGLRALIARPDAALVGLDFDGTLSPIVADPAQARPAPGARAAVHRLAERVGVLAIVTGRPAEIAAALLALGDASANVVVLGHYGLERWTPGGAVVRQPGADNAGVGVARAKLPALLRALGAPSGTAVEDKGESVAVHVRRATDPGAAFELLRAPLVALAHDTGLRLEPGRMVWELRPAGVDKGLALEALARERRAGAVCYAGDDLGDLAAFDALERLRADGVATLAVCSGSDDVPELLARADLVVDGPAGIVRLLTEISDAIDAAR